MIKLKLRSLEHPELETLVAVNPIEAIEVLGLSCEKYEVLKMWINDVLVDHFKILSQLVF